MKKTVLIIIFLTMKWTWAHADPVSIAQFRGDFYIFKEGMSYSFDRSDFKKFYTRYSENERQLVLDYTTIENDRREAGYYEAYEQVQKITDMIEQCGDKKQIASLKKQCREWEDILSLFQDDNIRLASLASQITLAYDMKERLIHDYIAQIPTLVIQMKKDATTQEVTAQIEWLDGIGPSLLYKPTSITYNETSHALQMSFAMDDHQTFVLKSTSVQKNDEHLIIRGDCEVHEQKDLSAIYTITQQGFFMVQSF